MATRTISMSSPKQKKSPRAPRLSTKKTPRNAIQRPEVSRKLFQDDSPQNANLLSPKNPKLHEKFNTRRSARRAQKIKDNKENVDSTNVVLKTPTNKTRRGVRTRQRAQENNDLIVDPLPKWIPENALCAAFKRHNEQISTISSQGLYVATSDICRASPFLGIFAGKRFEVGDIVTSYGGLLKTAHDVRKDGFPKSHVRRIPASIYVRDGLEWSRCFKQPPEWMKRQAQLPVQERKHVTPSRECPPELSRYFWRKESSPSTTPERVAREYRRMKLRIETEGLGYMSNTGPKAKHNVKVISVPLDRDGLHPRMLFYIAKRAIEEHEEIIAPYNNHDPSFQI